jgi:hypothetical protein
VDLTEGQGIKYVYYQIRDQAGLVSTYGDSIFLEVNDPPTVSAVSGPTSCYRMDTITINATAFDPDGDILTYEWNMDGTYVPDPPETGGASWTFTISNDSSLFGSHSINVRVMDPYGLYSDWKSMSFHILNHPPIAGGVGGTIDDAHQRARHVYCVWVL